MTLNSDIVSNQPQGDAQGDTQGRTGQITIESRTGVLDPSATEVEVQRHRVGQEYAVGQWYWVKDVRRSWSETTEEETTTPFEWLGCVMHVGSNYLEINGPWLGNSRYSRRVHFDECWDAIRIEANADAAIQERIEQYQNEAAQHMREIQAITARLGVSKQAALPGQPAQGSESGGALMVMSAQHDVKAYERALILAKDQQLPDLFAAVKKANERLVGWMTAKSLPMEALAAGMQGVVGDIKDRIFNVSLYAGLTEEVVQCCSGEPAAFHEKLHVMQRMAFMDEECIAHYRVGGMEFKDIDAFDAWVCEPENRDRLLPFPRTLVAMRVRRNPKERTWDGSIRGVLIKLQMENEDKLTFLYIRNGDRVHRLSCDLDFDEKIFPDRSEFDPSEPMMVRMFGARVQEVVSLSEYQARVGLDEAKRRAEPAWSFSGFDSREWQPFDPSSVYFDEASDAVSERIKKYNRVATIVQGLYDRSEVLHPHAPARTWTPDGFNAAIALVYDGSDVLHDGQAPNFEAYRSACNASLETGSVVIGQQLAWEKKEAERENERRAADWRFRNSHDRRDLKTYRPEGNPGPGLLANIAQWKPRSREAVFVWNRERLRDGGYYSGKRQGDPLRTTTTVAEAELFNVSAYKPGDFKQFFQDSRTRAQYMKWAPALLTAEEFHAGNLTVQEPVA